MAQEQKNIIKAFEWYSKSANEGYALGQYNLGYFYENAIGIYGKHNREAINWYKKTSDNGIEKAKN